MHTFPTALDPSLCVYVPLIQARVRRQWVAIHTLEEPVAEDAFHQAGGIEM
jgi:hypothetical protein